MFDFIPCHICIASVVLLSFFVGTSKKSGDDGGVDSCADYGSHGFDEGVEMRAADLLFALD